MRKDVAQVIAEFCRKFNEVGAGLPIRNSEMNVLKIICTVAGPHTSVQLADALGVTKPMITTLINSMVDSGYLARVPSPEDRRSFYIMPTKKGRNLMGVLQQKTDRFLTQIKSKIGESDFEMFIGLIERVVMDI